ncbi:A disintegrin and metalloproteinase with thrombospondin motifs 18-like [Oscarella lobularis]|uniref:A disintegrin and metalloproteinase with thrombospondin motifs 18-like n=1 Tax=Oscarella lobularis TaxID=121494 RepID=UPI003314455E
MQTSFYLIFVLAAVAATAVALPAPLIPNPNESSGDSVDPLPSHHLVHELEQFVSAANKLFNNSTFLLVEAITAWFNTLTANKYYTSTSGVEPESDAASSGRLCPVDLLMARRLVVDWCGVCGGINATCNVTVHHLHPQTTNSLKDAYGKVKIPSLVRNLLIEKGPSSSKTTLVLTTRNGSRVLLNGSPNATTITTHYHGTQFIYVRKSDGSERITMFGDTRKRLERSVAVQVANRGVSGHLPSVQITYVEPRPRKGKLYTWVTGQWTKCPVQGCGASVQRRYVECMREDSRTERPHKHCRKTGKRPAESKPCFNPTMCEVFNNRDDYLWVAGDWKPCSNPCGVQTRNISCYRKNGGKRHQVDRKKCQVAGIPEMQAERACPTARTNPSCHGTATPERSMCMEDRLPSGVCLLLIRGEGYRCDEPAGMKFCCKTCERMQD